MEQYLATLKSLGSDEPSKVTLIDHMTRQMFKYKPSTLPSTQSAGLTTAIAGHYRDKGHSEETKKQIYDSAIRRVEFIKTLVTENLRKLGIMSNDGFMVHGDLVATTFAEYTMSFLYGELSRHIGPMSQEETESHEATVVTEAGECFIELRHFLTTPYPAYENFPVNPETHYGAFWVIAGRWLKDPKDGLLHRHVYKHYGIGAEASS